jgi:2,3-diketo-5-methylthio-1-phosphopentane phosphatase
MDGSRIKIFVDFDGTISSIDIGKEIFLRFGNEQKTIEIVSKLHSGLISSRQCWEELISTVSSVNEVELHKLIDQVQIDFSFHDFIKFCNSKNIETFILSDGFDLYINRILFRENLDYLKAYSNTLRVENNKLIASFPYFNPEYPLSSNPKMQHIIDNSSDDDFTIYIGDGNSDKEAAQYCDLIFAKDSLLKFCETNRISFFPYKTFGDVTHTINRLLNKKRLRKSHQALLKRKIAYEAE